MVKNKDVIVKKNYDEMSLEAAIFVANKIKENPNCVLGLATGSTPLGLYSELIKMYKRKEIDFSNVTTFNLDEYLGLSPEHPQSYHAYMKRNFFDHVNIKPENIHIPDGLTKNSIEHCNEYERKIKEVGGIDLQVLGIGSNGHIGFNEPGSELNSRTRVVELAEKTRRDNSRFFDKIEDVPKKAITMGIATILESKNILLLASGENKAEAIKNALEGPITKEVPASFLQYHPNVTVILDEPAASKLEILVTKIESFPKDYSGDWSKLWDNNCPRCKVQVLTKYENYGVFEDSLIAKCMQCGKEIVFARDAPRNGQKEEVRIWYDGELIKKFRN
jgi:glucosamine-6-phosphate deaminase